MSSTDSKQHALVELCVKNISETQALVDKTATADKSQCVEMLKECVEMQIQFLHTMLCTPLQNNMCIPMNAHMASAQQVLEARQQFLQQLT